MNSPVKVRVLLIHLFQSFNEVLTLNVDIAWKAGPIQYILRARWAYRLSDKNSHRYSTCSDWRQASIKEWGQL